MTGGHEVAGSNPVSLTILLFRRQLEVRLIRKRGRDVRVAPGSDEVEGPLTPVCHQVVARTCEAVNTSRECGAIWQRRRLQNARLRGSTPLAPAIFFLSFPVRQGKVDLSERRAAA